MSSRALFTRAAPALRMVSSSRVPSAARNYATKQPNVTREFYKQFTRPIAKVLLLAVFTYQFAYWSWTKLETDEIRAERDATIAELEAKVHAYEQIVKAETKKS